MNVVGQVAVTKAMLPLIRSAGGRIVFIGSISGRVATMMAGPYCASKFAVEANSARTTCRFVCPGRRELHDP